MIITGISVNTSALARLLLISLNIKTKDSVGIQIHKQFKPSKDVMKTFPGCLWFLRNKTITLQSNFILRIHLLRK